MSKIIVIGGAAAVTLVVVFLVYRQLSRGNTKTQAELNQPGLSPIDAAKIEFEELMKNFFRQMINILAEFKNATSQEQMLEINGRAETIRIDGNLELTNMSKIIHEEYGIVMLPPAGADVDSMSLEEVDDIVFEWSSMCPKDGIIRQCITDARRERGDFDK